MHTLTGRIAACVLAAFLEFTTQGMAAALTRPSPDDTITWDGRVETRIPFRPNDSHGSEAFVGSEPTGTEAESLNSSVTPDIVFGTDNAVRINPTTNFPFRAVVYIETPGGAWCSGWLYAKNMVATAAHCLYKDGSWVSPGRIIPARDGTSFPYGYCGWTRLFVPDGFVQYETTQWKYDYGAIKLNCSIGNTVGWLGYVVTTGNVNGTAIKIDGYPQGKSPSSSMWQSPGGITDSATDILHYDADTWPGNSGSYVRRRSDDKIIAINSHDSHLLNFNAGTRITSTVSGNLALWKIS